MQPQKHDGDPDKAIQWANPRTGWHRRDGLSCHVDTDDGKIAVFHFQDLRAKAVNLAEIDPSSAESFRKHEHIFKQRRLSLNPRHRSGSLGVESVGTTFGNGGNAFFIREVQGRRLSHPFTIRQSRGNGRGIVDLEQFTTFFTETSISIYSPIVE